MLARYISRDTAERLGLRWPAFNNRAFLKDMQMYFVYHSYLEDKEINMVVIEKPGYGITQDKFYFSTFNGNSQVDDRETINNRFRKLVTKKHRIDPSKLEKIILKALR